MSDNNGLKLAELAIFLTQNGVGLGWGLRHEDKRWENEVRVGISDDWWIKDQGLTLGAIVRDIKKLLVPKAGSMWKKKEIAHETLYNLGIMTLYMDVPSIKLTCPLLSQ